MSNSKLAIEDTEYKSTLDKLWGIEFDVKKMFPQKISDWITFKSTILGVSPAYISIPLLVASSYCCQHTFVNAGNGIHTEPVILYALVAGRSGTNKSAALQSIMTMVARIEGEHVFESGTLEGLMKALFDNNETMIGTYDEFATFIDNLDKGTNGTFERSRYLSLHNGKSWSKKTKTQGSVSLDGPRFNLVSFTQPINMLKFSRLSNHDGLFQRFIITCPKEEFVYFEEKEKVFSRSDRLIDMANVLKTVYEMSKSSSPKEPIVLYLSKEAMNVYREVHDRIVSFRKEMKRDDQTSTVCKSIGMLLRIAGVLNRLREAAKKNVDDSYVTQNIITQEDMEMSKVLVNYSVESSFVALGEEEKPAATTSNISIKKRSIPDPTNMTYDFLVPHKCHVVNILNQEIIPLSTISGRNYYPTISKQSGASYSNKFVNGLCHLGLGEIVEGVSSSNSKVVLKFKRIHPEDETLPEEKRKKAAEVWDKLGLKIPFHPVQSNPSSQHPSRHSIHPVQSNPLMQQSSQQLQSLVNEFNKGTASSERSSQELLKIMNEVNKENIA